MTLWTPGGVNDCLGCVFHWTRFCLFEIDGTRNTAPRWLLSERATPIKTIDFCSDVDGAIEFAKPWTTVCRDDVIFAKKLRQRVQWERQEAPENLILIQFLRINFDLAKINRLHLFDFMFGVCAKFESTICIIRVQNIPLLELTEWNLKLINFDRFTSAETEQSAGKFHLRMFATRIKRYGVYWWNLINRCSNQLLWIERFDRLQIWARRFRRPDWHRRNSDAAGGELMNPIHPLAAIRQRNQSSWKNITRPTFNRVLWPSNCFQFSTSSPRTLERRVKIIRH